MKWLLQERPHASRQTYSIYTQDTLLLYLTHFGHTIEQMDHGWGLHK